MTRLIPFPIVIAVLIGCEADYMTNAEALEALNESNQSARGEAATREAIEISTDATIGDSVEAYVETLAAFWESQVDCTTVSWDGITVTVDYGDLADNCTYNGKTYAGLVEVAVSHSTLTELDLEHTWTGFNNGDVQVDGSAQVSWDRTSDTSTIHTEHTWTDLDDETSVDVEGDHVWSYIDSDQKILGGLTLNGTRDWTSNSKAWHLDMTSLEIRLQDPVPQNGHIELINPDHKTLRIDYSRIDESTIEAVISGLRQDLIFHINQAGAIVEEE
ncbi:MAG: hypothetical protein HN348_04850 [Proteobacteria bacterium]|nr:hypothetical protein [Pseudomonadota bacterium]